MSDRYRVFLLSPAHCGGERARLLLNERASFLLARRLQSASGAPLGEVFAFLSGLYFRGKLAYADAFNRPPTGVPGAVVITPNRGLVPPERLITLDDLRSFADVDIDHRDVRYRQPLEVDAQRLASTIGLETDVILLGSVATAKYIEVLSSILGDRLLFPIQFVGRGDMSRGGLLLRCVESAEELEYVPVAGAVRHGARPPKLPKKK